MRLQYYLSPYASNPKAKGGAWTDFQVSYRLVNAIKTCETITKRQKVACRIVSNDGDTRLFESKWDEQKHRIWSVTSTVATKQLVGDAYHIGYSHGGGGIQPHSNFKGSDAQHKAADNQYSRMAKALHGGLFPSQNIALYYCENCGYAWADTYVYAHNQCAKCHKSSIRTIKTTRK